jgi:NADPH:quinone reductase-like Zn-dependent oxidoreductase
MEIMKAFYLTGHGGPEVAEYGDVEIPSIGPNDVLVNIRNAALNHLDIWVREGWSGLSLQFPHVQGADGAGVVAAVGEAITNLQVGNPVVINGTLSDPLSLPNLTGMDNRSPAFSILGEHTNGTFAEYLAIPARNCLIIPDGVGYDVAAAASLVYLTAWHSLVTRANVQRGERVLIIGAGGGVNTASIEIARYLGAEVFVVGSNTEKLEKAKGLGADVVIDRSEEDWSRAVYKLSGKQGVDVVVDNVGQATFYNSVRSLRVGGRLVTVGSTSGPKIEIDNRVIFSKHLSILGSMMGTMADFHSVMKLVFDGTLKPCIDSTFPLSEAGAAQAKLEAGDFFGKIVLEVSKDLAGNDA